MSLGFIILRCVRSKDCKDYWIECYDAIRRFYPLNKILIIDDFSNYEFIDTNKILINTLIIQSEFKGRGELLPYYYYLRFVCWFQPPATSSRPGLALSHHFAPP